MLVNRRDKRFKRNVTPFSHLSFQIRKMAHQLRATIYLVFSPIVKLHFLNINTHTIHNTSIRFDEGRERDTSALKLFTGTDTYYILRL